jgi:hypothetical protein
MARDRILLLPIPSHSTPYPNLLDLLDFLIPLLDHEDELRQGQEKGGLFRICR